MFLSPALNFGDSFALRCGMIIQLWIRCARSFSIVSWEDDRAPLGDSRGRVRRGWNNFGAIFDSVRHSRAAQVRATDVSFHPALITLNHRRDQYSKLFLYQASVFFFPLQFSEHKVLFSPWQHILVAIGIGFVDNNTIFSFSYFLFIFSDKRACDMKYWSRSDRIKNIIKNFALKTRMNVNEKNLKKATLLWLLLLFFFFYL